MELPPWAQLSTYTSSSSSSGSGGSSGTTQHGRHLENSRPTNSREKAKKKGLADRIRPHSRIRTQNADVYMKINLQDLEAYTQDVLIEERARRRQCWLRVVGLVLTVALVVGTGVLVDYENDSHKKSSSDLRGTHHNAPLHPAGVVGHPEDHPLASCEVQLNHSKTFSEMVRDYQGHSENNEAWCQPTIPDCDWLNPTEPHPRQSHNQTIVEQWNLAHEQSRQQIAYMSHDSSANAVDVALIGDSMMYHLLGRGGSSARGVDHTNTTRTSRGSETRVVDLEEIKVEQQVWFTQEDLDKDSDMFEQLFTKQGGGAIDGLALGIGGDRCSNLLWRLQPPGNDTQITADTDESVTNTGALLSRQFAPKVWWIMIGTSDWELGVGADAIVAGIVTIVETIRTVHPEAQIVINSLLPRSSLEDNESVNGINNRISCFVKAQAYIDEDQHNLELIRQDLQSVSPAKQQPDAHPRPKRKLHFFNATNIFQERHEDGSFKINAAFLLNRKDGTVQAGRDGTANTDWEDFSSEANAKDTVDYMFGEQLWGQQIVENVLQLIEYDA